MRSALTYYSILTGLAPFEGKSAMDIMNGHCYGAIPDPCLNNPLIPSLCGDLVRRMMAKDPDSRPADSSTLLAELDRVLASASTPDAPALTWGQASPAGDSTKTEANVITAIEPITPVYRIPSRRTRYWFVGLCMLLMGGAYGIGIWQSRRALPAANSSPVPVDRKEPEAKAEILDTSRIKADGAVHSMAFDADDPSRLFWGTDKGEQQICWRPSDSLNRDRHRITGAKETPIPFERVVSWRIGGDPCWLSLFDGRLNFYESGDGRRISLPEDCVAAAGGSITTFAAHPSKPLVALGIHFPNKDFSKGGLLLRRLTKQSHFDCPAADDYTHPPVCLAFSTDGNYLLSGQKNGNVKVWLLGDQPYSTKAECREMLTSKGGIPLGNNCVKAVAGIGPALFAVASGHSVWLCDAKRGSVVDKAGQPTTSALYEAETHISVLIATPDGRLIAGAAGKSIFIIDSKSGEAYELKQRHTADVTALAFDREGQWLASGDKNGEIVTALLDQPK